MGRRGDKVELVGNRIMLTGAVLYLLEWVAIIWAGALGVQSVATVGASEADIVASYEGNADTVGAQLSPTAERHGLALALPEQVRPEWRARPGSDPRFSVLRERVVRIPLAGRDEREQGAQESA